MTLAGVFRGIGKQVVGSILIFINMYVISLGVALVLVIKYKMGPIGIYLGVGSGCLFDIIAYSIILSTYDFNILKIEALARVAKEVQAIKESKAAYEKSQNINQSKNQEEDTAHLLDSETKIESIKSV
jgi:hypothetical protein